ncbi:MAG: hypothetical protein AAF628_24615 [Planctomycetota bacterium]
MRGFLTALVIAATSAVLGYGLWLRLRPLDLDRAVRELVDGDADRHERIACLEVVLREGLRRAAAGDERAGVLAEMASLDLGRADEYQRAVELIGDRTPYEPGGSLTIDEACLGEPYLALLLRARLAPADEAQRLFHQSAVSASLFGADAVADVARQAAAGR